MFEFESEADRLAMIRALGGVSVSGPLGQLDGLLEVDPVTVDGMVDSELPRLIVRSSDAGRCGVVVDAAIMVDDTPYVVRRAQTDHTGMTTLTLEAP